MVWFFLVTHLAQTSHYRDRMMLFLDLDLDLSRSPGIGRALPRDAMAAGFGRARAITEVEDSRLRDKLSPIYSRDLRISVSPLPRLGLGQHTFLIFPLLDGARLVPQFGRLARSIDRVAAPLASAGDNRWWDRRPGVGFQRSKDIFSCGRLCGY